MQNHKNIFSNKIFIFNFFLVVTMSCFDILSHEMRSSITGGTYSILTWPRFAVQCSIILPLRRQQKTWPSLFMFFRGPKGACTAHCLPLHALLPEGVLHATPPLQGVPRRLGRVQLQFARLSGRGIGRAPLQGGEGTTEKM